MSPVLQMFCAIREGAGVSRVLQWVLLPQGLCFSKLQWKLECAVISMKTLVVG